MGQVTNKYKKIISLQKFPISDIKELISWYPNVSSLQRFGFLIEKYNACQPVINVLNEHLQKKNCYPVMLYPAKNKKPGKTGNRWKINVNIELESDL